MAGVLAAGRRAEVVVAVRAPLRLLAAGSVPAVGQLQQQQVSRRARSAAPVARSASNTSVKELVWDIEPQIAGPDVTVKELVSRGLM